MFQVTSSPIQPEDTRIDNPQAGGIVIFEGRVRDDSEGRAVEGLEYESYAELAETEGRKVIAEALEKFVILDARAIHRTGSLAIGEVAVRVEVAAKHRQAAYDASQYIISELKQRLPIWKKESFTDGESVWVNHP